MSGRQEAGIGKRRFYAAYFISLFWLLLGFGAVALAIGPDRTKTAVSVVDLAAETPASPRVEQKITASPGASGKAGESKARASEDEARLINTERVRAISALIRPNALAGIAPSIARNRAAEWVKAVKGNGASPLAAIGGILPPAEWFQARLVHRRDEYDLLEAVKLGGAYGKTYQAVNGMLGQSRASAEAIEAVMDTVWNGDGTQAPLKHAPTPVLRKCERWLPSISSLKKSHQYALDIFFTNVRRRGAEETGPVIKSMSSGIVVAASDNWKGGDTPASYRSGGLSPKAGNGVIVYDPSHRRYYAYFHMNGVYVHAGQIIPSGEALGRGGNTGTNARKKSHGAHVHIEIHDADGDAWSVYAIREYILSIR